MTPTAPPAPTYRLWARRSGRDRWSLEAVGDKADCAEKQQLLAAWGWGDFFTTDRNTDPNARKSA